MESLKIKEYLKGIAQELIYRTAAISSSLICSFFAYFCLFLFPVYVLFYVGSLEKGHIQPIQEIKSNQIKSNVGSKEMIQNK